MDEIFQRIHAYAKERHLTFTSELGAGIHGIVRTAKDNANFQRFAVKLHQHEHSYRREKAAYLRLGEANLHSIGRFNLPQLLRYDDRYLALELSIVVRPFILDFAETWLDEPPDLPQMVWSDEEAKIHEQFGDRANEVFHALALLRTHGLYMFDVSPSNIAFE